MTSSPSRRTNPVTGSASGTPSSSNALTMYPSIAAGSTAARTLAKGDVMGLRARYP